MNLLICKLAPLSLLCNQQPAASSVSPSAASAHSPVHSQNEGLSAAKYVEPPARIHQVEYEDASAMMEFSGPPPISKCWKSAVSFLQEDRKMFRSSNNRQELCNQMTDVQQKALALEIANCHMDDLGKPLFIEGGRCQNKHENSADSGIQKDPLYCLKELTDVGTVAYTQFSSHVQILCVRLTQEYTLEYQQAAQQQMLEKQQRIGSESLDSIDAWAKKHKAVLTKLATTVPGQVKDQLVETLAAHVEEVTYAQFQATMNKLELTLTDRLLQKLDSHLEAHKENLGAVLRDIADKQNHNLEKMMKMAREQMSSLYKGFAQWQEKMEDLIHEQEQAARSVMDQVQHIISQVEWFNAAIKSLGQVIMWAWDNISWLYFAFFLLGSLIFWTRMTTSRGTKPARGYVLWFFVLGALVELHVRLGEQHHFMMPYGYKETFWKDQESPSIVQIRTCTFACQFLIYSLRWLLGFVLPTSHRHRYMHDDDDDDSFMSDGADSYCSSMQFVDHNSSSIFDQVQTSETFTLARTEDPSTQSDDEVRVPLHYAKPDPPQAKESPLAEHSTVSNEEMVLSPTKPGPSASASGGSKQALRPLPLEQKNGSTSCVKPYVPNLCEGTARTQDKTHGLVSPDPDEGRAKRGRTEPSDQDDVKTSKRLRPNCVIREAMDPEPAEKVLDSSDHLEEMDSEPAEKIEDSDEAEEMDSEPAEKIEDSDEAEEMDSEPAEKIEDSDHLEEMDSDHAGETTNSNSAKAMESEEAEKMDSDLESNEQSDSDSSSESDSEMDDQ